MAKKRPFIAVNLSLRIFEKADNQSTFARKYNLKQTLISRCLRGVHSGHRGWVFSWVDKKEPYDNEADEMMLLSDKGI